MKKKRKLIFRLVIILLIIAALGSILVLMWPKNNKKEEAKIINKIDGYGYTLANDETSLHKKYFNELVDVLKADKVDEEAYAKLVVQLFVSDFYNLDNKTTKNNVGGIQYVLTTAQDNMALKAKDTIYKYVESNLDGNRKQELPIVKDVKITDIKQKSFKYGKTTDSNAYVVEATWTYAKDLGYQDKATATIVHEDKKLSIAELD